jgi:glycosyltransferase involved in cell wall biosynthesis
VASALRGKGAWRRLLRSIGGAARLWRWKLFLRPRAATIEDIKSYKERQRLAGHAYLDHPTVSVIIQSFNQVRNVAALERRLRLTCADELIVCEDGSIDGSHDAWLRRLVYPNDFLIHSNDVHEIRSYARAIAFARGDIVCLMQDDDRPPRDGTWLAKAVRLFEHYPRLAVLGGWCGFDDYFAIEYNAPWLPSGAGRIPSVDPHTGVPLVFVENVNIGPYLLRKRVFDQIGGFDLSFSRPGEPGITFEAEFCYRAWRNGHQVALTDIPVKLRSDEEAYILPGGTSLWGHEARIRNERANKQRIRELYEAELPLIRAAVRTANRGLAHDAVDP